MKFLKGLIFCLTGVVFFNVWGSGYGVYEQGIQGMGSAGAFVARAEDGSALFYNPAGLSQLRFSELALDLKPVFSKSYYSNAGQSTWDTETATEVLPHFFWNGRFRRVSFGFGSATTFNRQLSWEDPSFPGRFLSTGSEVRVREYIGGMSFKMRTNFSVGAAVRFAQADYQLSRTLARPFDQGRLFYETAEVFDGDSDALGVTLGFQYYRSRRLSVGAVYQSAIDLDFEGSRSFTQLTRLNDVRATSSFDQLFQTADMKTNLELPERIALGFATKITVRTRVEVDLSTEKWSTNGDTVIETFDVAGDAEQIVLPSEGDDVLSIRLSGDFQQRKALLWRIGIASSDKSQKGGALNPSFPDSEQFMYAFGVSWTFRPKYILEAGLLYVQNKDQRVEDQEFVFSNNPPDYLVSTGQSGLYETQHWHFNMGARIRFGEVLR